MNKQEGFLLKALITKFRILMFIGLLFIGSINLHSIEIISQSDLESKDYTILEVIEDGYIVEVDGYVYIVITSE